MSEQQFVDLEYYQEGYTPQYSNVNQENGTAPLLRECVFDKLLPYFASMLK